MSLQPTTLEALQEIVETNQSLLPVGGGSKPALSAPFDGATRLDMSRLAGIIEYEPGEYTFTAYAGTPVRDIVAALAEHGQYLPFDPPLVERGATLGGVVAANTAGSARYRYGGVRDFIIGVRFIDGQGQLVRGGGKVVKNAAGFDLPKFMVGSAGRFGAFVDLSFKVFPEPRAYVTLKFVFAGLGPALEALSKLGTAPNEMDVLDLKPLETGQVELVARLGGLSAALPGRIERLQSFVYSTSETRSHETIETEADAALWQQVNAFAWVTADLSLVKVPVSPKRIPLLENVLRGLNPLRRYTAGGNIAWLAVPDVDPLDTLLNKVGLPGLVLFGPPGRPFLGPRRGLSLARRVKTALDPAGSFLEI